MEIQPRRDDIDKNLVQSSETNLFFSRSEIRDGRWIEFAACRQYPTEIFFPNDTIKAEVAKAICRNCVVREPCLEYAIVNNINDGVWGGTSERERRKIAKRYKAS